MGILKNEIKNAMHKFILSLLLSVSVSALWGQQQQKVNKNTNVITRMASSCNCTELKNTIQIIRGLDIGNGAGNIAICTAGDCEELIGYKTLPALDPSCYTFKWKVTDENGRELKLTQLYGDMNFTCNQARDKKLLTISLDLSCNGKTMTIAVKAPVIKTPDAAIQITRNGNDIAVSGVPTAGDHLWMLWTDNNKNCILDGADSEYGPNPVAPWITTATVSFTGLNPTASYILIHQVWASDSYNPEGSKQWCRDKKINCFSLNPGPSMNVNAGNTNNGNNISPTTINIRSTNVIQAIELPKNLKEGPPKSPARN